MSDTTTPGHVYELSAEHHLFNEIKLDRVENWDFNAPQTEEEAADEPRGRVAGDQLVEEHHHRQLSRLPRDAEPRAVSRGGPHRQLVGHPFPQRARQGRERLRHLRRERLRHVPARQQVPVRERDSGRDAPPRGARARIRRASTSRRQPAAPAPSDASAVVAPGAKVERLEGGFYAISGADRGRRTARSISSITISTGSSRGPQADGLNVVRHDPLDPVNLAVDKSGHLLVQSSDGPEGTVYSFRPGTPADQITVLQPQDEHAASGRRSGPARQRVGQRRIRQPARSRHATSTRRSRRCSRAT